MKLVVPGALPFYLAAISAWLALALVLAVKHRGSIRLFKREYWAFLLEPWKLFTFFGATALITIAAPHSGDPTWDLPDSLLISGLTFVLAPWSLAVLYRAVTGRILRRPQADKTSGAEIVMASAAFFVPCWAYDIYILFRDSYYPTSWDSNLVLSGGVCVLAGMFWNLAEGPDGRAVLAFRLPEWPLRTRTRPSVIAMPASLVAVPVLIMVTAFVIEALSHQYEPHPPPRLRDPASLVAASASSSRGPAAAPGHGTETRQKDDHLRAVR